MINGFALFDRFFQRDGPCIQSLFFPSIGFATSAPWEQDHARSHHLARANFPCHWPQRVKERGV